MTDLAKKAAVPFKHKSGCKRRHERKEQGRPRIIFSYINNSTQQYLNTVWKSCLEYSKCTYNLPWPIKTILR